MQIVAYILSALVALAIIVIGTLYVGTPRRMTGSFGLADPGGGAEVDCWLRLKGVRDIVSGLVVVACMIWGGPRMVGVILLVEALIPTGDMLVVLTSGGSTGRALGIHGATAIVMVIVGLSLILIGA